MTIASQHQAPLELPVTERTLPRILALQAERIGDEPFLAFGESAAETFAELESRTSRIANALAAHGVGAGERVALMLPNCSELVATWFAAAKLGAIQVPLNPELRGTLLTHALRNAEPCLVVCDASRLDALAAVSRDFPLHTVVLKEADVGTGRSANVRCAHFVEFEELESHPNASTPAVEVRSSDPISILYTSGTTGPAKGVVMPHLQYWAWVEGMARNMGLTTDDSYYSPLPLFHADAQLFGVYYPLIFGTRGTIDDRFSASRYWSRIRACGATATNLLGAMTHILWKAEARPEDRDNPLRVCQALPMVPFKEAFQERFDVQLVTAYGQTETNFVTLDTPGESRDGSCGRPAPGYVVKVVDAEDRPLPAGESGEIVVRHDDPFTVALGYYRMPEKTVGQMRNLWWHSGDRGHFDHEGWLYFDGRINDVIRRRGENISAEEIENIVDTHPAVLESAAVAVPSEMSEDEVLVVASVREGHVLSEPELIDFCGEHMPRHMVPRYVELRRDLLPRTPSEKIARSELRDGGLRGAAWDRELQAHLADPE